MDFLKKHYEKILLGIVLVGLAVGTAFLPIMISGEREQLENMRISIIQRKIEPLKPLDLTQQDALFKRAETPFRMDFSEGHRLFNPVPWVKTADGRIIKAQEGNIGPKAVIITKITPLYTTVSFDSLTVTDSGVRYILGIQREAATYPSQRSKRQYYASLNVKNDAFIIRSVKGPPEDPAELTVELNDTGETISVSRDRPFRKVDGYMADLKYEPERKTWTSRRVGNAITLGGEDYIIVAISEGEVVLSAKSNNKKTPISYNPAAESR